MTTESLLVSRLFKRGYWRFLKEKNIRRLRSLVRQPQLWARLFNATVPCSFSASRGSRLNRPETIRISASGKRAIVSNSHSRSITVYSIDRENSAKLRLQLIDYFSDDHLLHYAHGATFACSDKLYLAVGEYSNTLSAVSSEKGKPQISNRVVWSLKGLSNGLDNPSDIAIHPSQRYLVIANRLTSGLCFFSIGDDLQSEPPELVLSLTIPELNKVNVAAPHGVAFSANGRFLFVTHKPHVWSKGDAGHSAITVYRADAEIFEAEHWAPLAVQYYEFESLHSIDCHPTDSIIAFTDTRGPLQILSWDQESHKFSDVGKIDVFRQGEGAKGVCFMEDGNHIAVTSELDEVLTFNLRKHAQLFESPWLH